MDKTGIIVVSICVVLLGWWFVEQNKIAQQQAQYQAQYAATNQIAQAQNAISNSPAMTPAEALPETTATATAFDTNLPEQTIVLSNAKTRYTFTSRGGGLKQVELLDYPETISARWKKENQSEANGVAVLNARAAAPVLSVVGSQSFIGDGNFVLTKIADGVRAEKSFSDGLRLVKDFHIGTNYLVNATVRWENNSAKPLALPAQDVVVGTASPMDVDDTSFAAYGGAMWCDGAKSHSATLAYFNPSTKFLFFFSRTPKTEFDAGDSNVVWVAAYNQFFTLMAMPQKPAQQVIALPVTLPPFPNVDQAPGTPLPRGVQAELVYPAQTLTANSSVERQIVLYAGPKEYRRLADIGAEFNNRADDVMGFGSLYGFCAKPLLLAMNWLHDMLSHFIPKISYGWIIVLLTVLLRAIFWPLTAASTRSMKRMQALAPEVNALKEKYKNDPQKFTQKQMELWKKHKVNPMSGCLPMLIQMPVFFGFFTMIRSAIELRGAHFLWATDLSKPDTLFMIPGLNIPFNLLPLLMGGAMLWQSHLTPASPGMDQSQAKMMRYMPLLFLVFLYNYSAGMALYMVISTMASVLQTKLTRNLKDPMATPALTPAPKSKK